MHGWCVLLLVAATGVQYGWERNAQGELEYIIQLEPELLQALAEGEEVVSFIHPDVRNVRRFRVRVGTQPPPREGALPDDAPGMLKALSATGLPDPERSAREWETPREVVRGQLDADPLPLPALGDLAQTNPRYGSVVPAQATTTGSNPRYGTTTGQSATPGNPVYSGQPLTNSWNPSSFFQQPSQQVNTGGGGSYNPIYNTQGSGGATDSGWATQGTAGSQTNPAGASGGSTQQPTQNYAVGANQNQGTNSGGYLPPANTGSNQQPNYGSQATLNYSGGGLQQPSAGGAAQQSAGTGFQQPSYNQPNYNPPNYNQATGSQQASGQPNYSQPNYSQPSSQQLSGANQAYAQNTYGQNPYLQAGGQQQPTYAGATGNNSGSQQQPGYAFPAQQPPSLQPPANAQPQWGAGNWPLVDTRPTTNSQPNWQTPPATQSPTRPVYTAFAPDAARETQPTGFSGGSTQGSSAPTNTQGSPSSGPQQLVMPTSSGRSQEIHPEDRPWGPLTFALLLLFGSLGGNFYLSWLAWDFYIRYRTLLLETSATPSS